MRNKFIVAVFAVAAAVFGPASAGATPITYYLNTGTSGSPSSIDNGSVVDWLVATGSGSFYFGGGNFAIAGSNSATAGVTLTLYDGQLSTDAVLASVSKDDSVFTNSYSNVIQFHFATPPLLDPNRTYLVRLSSTDVTSGYSIKAPQSQSGAYTYTLNDAQNNVAVLDPVAPDVREPGSLALIGLGFGMLGALRRGRRAR